MEKKLLIVLFSACAQLLLAQSTTSVPDVNFEQLLIDKNIDSDGVVNGKVLTSDINKITNLSLSTIADVRDLKGIEGFAALEEFYINSNYLVEINLSQNTNLKIVSLTDTQTPSLNFNNNTKLEELGIYDTFNSLQSLSITGCTNLKNLSLTRTSFTTFDFSANINLEELYLQENQFTSINVSQNSKLIELNCSENNISSLDISNLPALEFLDASGNNISELYLPNNINYIDLRHNVLTTLDLTDNTNLNRVYLDYNKLTFLDVRNGNNTSINGFSSKNNPNLACILVDNKEYSDNNWSGGKDATSRFSEECNEQTYIADTNFENYLEFKGFGNGDYNDNSVDTANISGLINLDISDENIADLTGIEDFISLKTLDASGNEITILDLSKNINLETLNLAQNPTTGVDVSKNTKLTSLNISGNQLTTLNISKNTALTVLDVKLNQLTTLDLNMNVALKELNIGSNTITDVDLSALVNLERLDGFSSGLTSIDITKNKKLYYADLSGNELEYLDLYGNTQLGRLRVDYNKLKYLDIQNNESLVELNASFNQLEGLNLKNERNNILFNIDISNNPNLTCVEVDNVSFSTNNWPNKDAQTSFSLDCIPINDDCSNAIPLTFGQETPGDINSGNANNNAPCAAGNVIADVWFSFVVQQSGEFSVEGSSFGEQLKFAVYETCTSAVPIACGENISLTNLTVGAKLNLKAWLEGSSNKSQKNQSEAGTFTFTAQETSVLSTDSFTTEKNELFIYPNPATSFLNIKTTNQKQLDFVEIYNVLGKRVLFKNVSNSSTIDVSNLSAGIYILKAKVDNQTLSKKLIIN